MLGCTGRAEGKLDSRLITEHTWDMPQHVVNVLISKLSTADGWVYKQTVIVCLIVAFLRQKQQVERAAVISTCMALCVQPDNVYLLSTAEFMSPF